MEPFLQKTAHYLLATYGRNLGDICIVLPNRRGGLFLRQYLAKEAGEVIWSPAILSVEDFIADVSGLQQAWYQ